MSTRTNYFPLRNYYFYDDLWQKTYAYELNYAQRIFILLTDPTSSKLGYWISTLILGAILLSCIEFVISTLPAMRTQPQTCPNPTCQDDPHLCPNRTVCEPVQEKMWDQIETVCVMIFTIDYGIRVLTAWMMPERLLYVIKVPKEKRIVIDDDIQNMTIETFFKYVQSLVNEIMSDDLGGDLDDTAPKQFRKNHHDNNSPKGGKQSSTRESISSSETPRQGALRDRIGDGVPSFGSDKGPETRMSPELSLNADIEAKASSNSVFTFHDHEYKQMNTAGADQDAVASKSVSEGRSIEGLHKLESARSFSLPSKSAGAVTVYVNSRQGTKPMTAIKDFERDDARTMSPWTRALFYIFDLMNLVDLVAIAPYYLVDAVKSSSSNYAVVRVLRLGRLFRVLKLGRGNVGVQLLVKMLAKSIHALSYVAFFIFLFMVVYGSVMYLCEQGTFVVDHDFPTGAYVRPEPPGGGSTQSPFNSIPASIYWAVVTSTTVGYGDLAPTTWPGRLVSVLVMYTGVVLISLPITLIGNAFHGELEKAGGEDDGYLVMESLLELIGAYHREFLADEGAKERPDLSFFKHQRLTAVLNTLKGLHRMVLKEVLQHELETHRLIAERELHQAEERAKKAKLARQDTLRQLAVSRQKPMRIADPIIDPLDVVTSRWKVGGSKNGFGVLPGSLRKASDHSKNHSKDHSEASQWTHRHYRGGNHHHDHNHHEEHRQHHDLLLRHDEEGGYPTAVHDKIFYGDNPITAAPSGSLMTRYMETGSEDTGTALPLLGPAPIYMIAQTQQLLSEMPLGELQELYAAIYSIVGEEFPAVFGTSGIIPGAFGLPAPGVAGMAKAAAGEFNHPDSAGAPPVHSASVASNALSQHHLLSSLPAPAGGSGAAVHKTRGTPAVLATVTNNSSDYIHAHSPLIDPIPPEIPRRHMDEVRLDSGQGGQPVALNWMWGTIAEPSVALFEDFGKLLNLNPEKLTSDPENIAANRTAAVPVSDRNVGTAIMESRMESSRGAVGKGPSATLGANSSEGASSSEIVSAARSMRATAQPHRSQGVGNDLEKVTDRLLELATMIARHTESESLSPESQATIALQFERLEQQLRVIELNSAVAASPDEVSVSVSVTNVDI